MQVRPEQHSEPPGHGEPLGAQETASEHGLEAVWDALSVAETETDAVPAAAGVPVIEEPEAERPEGRPLIAYA